MASASARLSAFLQTSKGAHPATRLDGFLRIAEATNRVQALRSETAAKTCMRHDCINRTASAPSTLQHPHGQTSFVDLSNLPPTWMDPRGEPKELSFSYEAPPAEASNRELLDMYANRMLMTPSERYQEHQTMKACEKKWREDRNANFFYKKRMKALGQRHRNGIVGIDSPMHPGTRLFAQERNIYEAHCGAKMKHADNRSDLLEEKQRAHDAIAHPKHDRSAVPSGAQGLGTDRPRRRVDPQRFLDTHSRLFVHQDKWWDPERAAMLRSHDVRDKTCNLVDGTDNTLQYRVRTPLGERDGPRRTHPEWIELPRSTFQQQRDAPLLETTAVHGATSLAESPATTTRTNGSSPLVSSFPQRPRNAWIP